MKSVKHLSLLSCRKSWCLLPCLAVGVAAVCLSYMTDSDAVSAELYYGGSCSDNTDCNDHDPCTVDVCDSGTCTYPERLYGDINYDGARNIVDVLCASRVIFEAATECNGFVLADPKRDVDYYRPNICGDELHNQDDVDEVARAVFQDAPDLCCE